MKHERHIASSFDFGRIVLRPIIPVLLILLLLSALLTSYLRVRLENGWMNLTDLVTVEIRHDADGTPVQYDGNAFPVVNRGDRLTVRIPLPEECRVDNAVVGFNIPHVAGSATCNGKTLWSYGEEIYARGGYVGNLFFRVPVENEMWGSEMELHLTVTENNAFSSILGVQAMPAANSIRYFFSQFQLNMLLFVTICIMATFATVVFLFYRGGQDLRWEGLFLAGFCGILSAWFLAGHGFLYAFSDNITVCAHAEYVLFYQMPIPFCLFMCTQVKSHRVFRRIQELLTGVFVVLFVVATVLNYTTAEYHYTTFLPVEQVFMVVGVVSSVLMLVHRQYADDLSSTIIRWGVSISMLILMLEVAFYNIGKYLFVGLDLEDLSFASMGMLTFAGTLVLGYAARLTNAVSEESDKALLRRLAYVDVLTGISNRAYCNQKIEEMEQAGEKHFALLFFDLNGLKWANDNYGHDMGDRFICIVAKNLQKLFGQQEFCGRWGGDEFIACLTGENTRYAEKLLRDFDQEITRLNESGEFPFRISVAYGMVRSTEQEVLTVNEAIKEADRRMYTAKIKMYDEKEAPGTMR